MQRAGKGQVYVLLAAGFEEYDVTTVTRTLRRAGLPVVLVGLTAGPIRGCYGISLAPDKALSEVEAEHPLAIVLPGGTQGTRQLNADPRVHRLLRRTMECGGYLATFNTGHTVLRTAGVLDGAEKWPPEKVATGSQDGAIDAHVVINGRLIWGRDPEAVQELAMSLLSALETSLSR